MFADPKSNPTNQIRACLERLRGLSQRSLQGQWRYYLGELSILEALLPATWQGWQPVPTEVGPEPPSVRVAPETLSLNPLSLNSKGQLVWPAGRQVLWLGQEIRIPDQFEGYSLTGLLARLGLAWWAEEAQIYLDGKLVQAGDLFDSQTRILLRPPGPANHPLQVALRLVSPSHDRGAVVRTQLILETSPPNLPEPAFIADELTLLLTYLEKFQPHYLPTFAQTLGQIDWKSLGEGERFQASLGAVRQQLLPLLQPPQTLFQFTAPESAQESTLEDGQTDQSEAEHVLAIGEFTELGNTSEDTYIQEDTVIQAETDVLEEPAYAPEVVDYAEIDLWATDEAEADVWATGEIDTGTTKDESDQTYPASIQATAEQPTPGPRAIPRSSVASSFPSTFASMSVEKPLQRQINLIGHAHLDLAWLWPVSETWQVAENTFQSVLNLQQDFPHLTFCHSSPALFAWLESHRPELFGQIQTEVAAGRWEIVAGLWVEPDLNLIAGESLVRQILYGQRYVQSRFGRISPIAWLPDTFGFCWQLPQLLRQGGIEFFVTQKLRWNDTTTFPHQAFYWQAPDGSQIFSYMSAPIGEGIDPVKMVDYATDWELATQTTDCLWLPGVGDHGGGPTRDMLELAERWQASPFLPNLNFTKVEPYLRQLEAELKDLLSHPHPGSEILPVWQDELYLEFHRGCYTTHADQKRANRRSEVLLFEAELFASLAHLVTGLAYPAEYLEVTWKQVLFNQFHDILPGSAIPAVFVDANQDWATVQAVGEKILQSSLQHLTAAIVMPDPPQPGAIPVVVFNALNWSRSGMVKLYLLTQPNTDWQVYTTTDQILPAQIDQSTVQFWATDIPANGYALFWLVSQNRVPEFVLPPTTFLLENQHLQATINPVTGALSQLRDKHQDRELLQGDGNQLQFFKDQGQYWDAWNIDPDYVSHPLPGAELQSIRWLSADPLEQRLEVVYRFQSSRFCQIYTLAADSPYLKVETWVNWQERHVLVKAAFPLQITANAATYETLCAAIERPTLPNPETLDLRQAAKWEVPALRWADLTGSDADGHTWGLSVLNDCKYGYDASPNCLRLTLLRGSVWPDPEADMGEHHFCYALYPHADSWQAAQTVRLGYEFNHALQPVLAGGPAPNAKLPPRGSFFTLGNQGTDQSADDSLVLMAFKQAERAMGAVHFAQNPAPANWIVRCYESQGQPSQIHWQSQLLDLVPQATVDILETPLSAGQPNSLNPLPISPWQVVSLRLQPKLST